MVVTTVDQSRRYIGLTYHTEDHLDRPLGQIIRRYHDTTSNSFAFFWLIRVHNTG